MRKLLLTLAGIAIIHDAMARTAINIQAKEFSHQFRFNSYSFSII